MKFIIRVTFLLCSMYIMGQAKLETVQRFPFNSPFTYITDWDPIEGGHGGVSDLLFLDKYRYIVNNSLTGEFSIFNISDIIPKASTSVKTNNLVIDIRKLGNSVIFCNAGNSVYTKLYSISNIGISQNVDFGKAGIFETIAIPYFTGSLLFSIARESNKLISWHPINNGNVSFRNEIETALWLSQGNAEKCGYREDSKWGHWFGEINLVSSWPPAYDKILGQIIQPDPLPKTGPVTISSSCRGIDNKGIVYFCSKTLKSTEIKRTDNPCSWTIIAVDFFTKKSVAREIPPGQWNPPRKKGYGFIGSYEPAISPDGHFYIFDCDVALKEYQLKRLENDWWQELGVTDRNVGRINTNHIGLKEIPKDDSADNGFNFENELVWILEESKTTGMVNGKSYPWVRVRKMSEREGWILAGYYDLLD